MIKLSFAINKKYSFEVKPFFFILLSNNYLESLHNSTNAMNCFRSSKARRQIQATETLSRFVSPHSFCLFYKYSPEGASLRSMTEEPLYSLWFVVVRYQPTNHLVAQLSCKSLSELVYTKRCVLE